MGALIDALVGIAVVFGFIFLIWVQLIKKYPKLKDSLSGFNPTKIYKEDPIKPSEEKKQIWTENRSMI